MRFLIETGLVSVGIVIGHWLGKLIILLAGY